MKLPRLSIKASAPGRRASIHIRAGFTLVELMVSIVIAVMLILGVNMVFRAAAKTSGTGQALSTVGNDARTVQSVLQRDLTHLSKEQPLLIIRNEQVYAFRNADDEHRATAEQQTPTSQHPNPYQDKLFPGQTVPPGSVNYRSHRVDRLGFFVRELLTRQTASDPPGGNAVGNYTSTTTSEEGWVWYGHTAVPNNNWLKSGTTGAFQGTQDTNVYGPGEPDRNASTNDNNYYASDWILGRHATLLVNEHQPNPPDVDFLQFLQPSPSASVPAITWLNPLVWFSPINNNASTAFKTGETSRWDVADGDMADFYTNHLAHALLVGAGASPAAPPTPLPQDQPSFDWYDHMVGFNPNISQLEPTGNVPADHRFWANPFINSAPPAVGATNTARLNAQALSMASPALIRGCVHFIVEYTGNYLRQDDDPLSPTYGGVIGPGPDPDPRHSVDFFLAPDTRAGGHWVRRIRWYGFPRDTNGDGIINGYDVVPLRDVLATAGGALPMPFERVGVNLQLGLRNVQSFPQAAQPIKGSGWDTSTNQYPFDPTFDYNSAPNCFPNLPLPRGSQPLSYTCAWGPDTPPELFPKMLRITIVIDDPSGRLVNPPTFEYIITLQQKQ